MDCRYLLWVVAQLVVACSANTSSVDQHTTEEDKVENDFPSGVYFYLSSYKKLVDENKLLREVIDEHQARQNSTIAMEEHLQRLEDTTRQLSAQLSRNGSFLRHIRGLHLVDRFDNNNWAMLKKGLLGLLDHDDVAYKQLQKLPDECEKSMECMETIVQSGDRELLEVLLNYGLDVDMREAGNTILHLTARFNMVNMAEMLLERGASTSVRDTYYETPLIKAAACNNLPMLRLLKESGAHIDAANDIGWTGLHYAADKGFLEVARYLVESGANTGKIDNTSTTPLELARRGGHKEVVNILS